MPHAGWRVIAAKEFGDHLLSVRFIVLLIVLGLAAAIPLYFAADQIRAAAAAGERHPGRLPRPVHRSARRTIAFLQRRLVRRRSSRRCSASPSRSTPSTASAPRGRCRASSPSRSTATTSSTASSRPGWRSSGSCWWRSSAIIAGFGIFRLGIVPHAEEILRLVAWVARHVPLRRRSGWPSGCSCRSLVRRAATSALIGFGVWLLFTIFGGRSSSTLSARRLAADRARRHRRPADRAGADPAVHLAAAAEPALPEVTDGPARPDVQPAGRPCRLARPGPAGAAADPDAPRRSTRACCSSGRRSSCSSR